MTFLLRWLLVLSAPKRQVCRISILESRILENFAKQLHPWCLPRSIPLDSSYGKPWHPSLHVARLGPTQLRDNEQHLKRIWFLHLFSDADASKGSNTWVGLDSIGHLSYFMSFGEWWRTWVIFSLKMAFGRFGSYSLHQIAGFMTFYKFLTSPTVMVCAIWYEVHIYGTHGTNITFLYILRNVLLKAQI